MRWKLIGNAVNVRVSRWLGERLASPGDILIPNAQPLSREQPWPIAAFNVGDGRYSAGLSTWPKAARHKSLQDFLGSKTVPLSRRATAGFLERTRRARLRFPSGFIAAVEKHLHRMQ
jgi:DNA (cytosine-5)-methyltransferase 1